MEGPAPDSLAPTLLLAMPQLRDPNFARSRRPALRARPEGRARLRREPSDRGARRGGGRARAAGPGRQRAHAVDRRTGRAAARLPPSRRRPVRRGQRARLRGLPSHRLGRGAAPPARVAQRRAGRAARAPAARLRRLGARSARLRSSRRLRGSPPRPIRTSSSTRRPSEMWERAIRGLGVDPMALQVGDRHPVAAFDCISAVPPGN